jgi:hypothetical protein
MESGNIVPKDTIRMDYCACSYPPFDRSINEMRILVSPHQTKSLDSPQNNYKPLNFSCKTLEIDCACLQKSPKLFDSAVDDFSGNPTLLWIDPAGLPTECIASIVANWRDIAVGKNIAIGIVIPEGDTLQKISEPYELWKADAFGFAYASKSSTPVWWYPSLSRNSQSLEHACAELDPYDVFPLVEFPNRSIQWGERIVTDHYYMLEMSRTRTRNFIYLDSLCPDQAFNQFYGTLRAIPNPSSLISRPVLTPGGSTNGFMTTLIAGALTQAYFLTPKNEIPINSNAKTQGIMILRKCT